MPLHLDAMTNDSQNPSYLAHILGPLFQNTCEAFATPDKRFFCGRSRMIDSITNEPIGNFVYTIWSNEKERCNEIQDLDITLDNPTVTPLRFLEMLDKSEDTTEYYNVETEGEEAHLQIETVNRLAIPGSIVNSTQNAYISAFPFQLTMFDSIDDLNRLFGFKERTQVGSTDLYVSGLSDTFIAPSGVLSDKDEDDVYTLMFGTVTSVRNVQVDMGITRLDFVLAQVRTALGIIPVAMGRDAFNIEGIRPGKVLAMNAYVKADLARPEVFQH
jgi:hypothetical protein